MTGLDIAPTLTLPLEAVTETFAILAKRGKGKTNTAVVLVEEFVKAGLPAVVVDPVGVWWGLTSSADGQSEGLPVVIFGGDHGDVPLEPGAGALIAEVLVEERFTAVLDLSLLSKTQSRTFMTAFIETLYHRNRDAMHVVVDEADAFAPQRAAADGARLLGAMEDLVRRGRARGLGVTLITQRPAVLHKDVLTQAEVLIALGMTGPRDVAAIDEWVRLHADEDQARQLKASLPSLPVGTAWVWSPGWLDILQRVEIRARRTFDSSATPKPGEQRRTPSTRAEVDLATLGAKITATVEKVKADDPKVLRGRIAELERDLATERAKPSQVETVEVPALDPAVADRLHASLARVLEDLPELVGALSVLRDHRVNGLRPTTKLPMAGNPGQPTTRNSAPRATSTGSTSGRAPDAGSATTGETAPSARETRPAADGANLPKAQRAILTVLAQHGPLPRPKLAVRAGYSATGGGFNNALSALRSAGYIYRGEPLIPTAAGLHALGAYEPLPTGPALVEHFARQLTKAAREIVDVLVDVWPDGLAKDDLAARTPSQYSPTGGGFNNALSRLRSLDLVTTTDGITTVAEELVT